MTGRFMKKRTVLGKEISAEIMKLDQGFNVLLIGGEKSHIGAVSHAFPSGEIRTIELPGHKEKIVTEKWAKELAVSWKEDVCVECGIHYDSLSKTDIQIILEKCDEMLKEILLQ